MVDTTVAGATANGSVGASEYVGTVSGGGGGFGGPVGGATLSVDSDDTNVYFGLSDLGDYTGNSIRMYFDTRAGGFSTLSDAAGMNDFDDFGRERLSRPAADGLTLPFPADYGVIISPAFSGFSATFELATGGNGSLTAQPSSGSAVGESPTNGTFELSIPLTSLGITEGKSAVDFVVIYGNNDGQDSAFLSNEAFPYQGSDTNPGVGPVTLSDYHRLVTVPEASSVLFGGLVCGLAASRRLARRRG